MTWQCAYWAIFFQIPILLRYFADVRSFGEAALPLHVPLAQPDPVVFLDEEDLDLTLSFLLFDALDLALVSDHRVGESFTVENFIIDFHH